MNCAWKGIELYSLTQKPLSLKERAIFWLIGSSLMIPFVNSIIWIAWQTFGNPEKLFDPYCPEVDLPPPIVYPQQNISPPQTLPPEEQKTREQLAYHETEKDSTSRTNWTLEYYPRFTIVQEHTTNYSSSSVYKIPDHLVEFQLTSDNESFSICRQDDLNQLQVRLVKNEDAPIEKVFELAEPIRWIQQPTIGFKDFVLSNDRGMSFYVVLPENRMSFFYFFPLKGPLLMKCIAKKIREEEIIGHGKLIKIEITSTWGWPYNLSKAELWFDPATGILRKFIDPGLFFKKSGELVLDHPLPAPAHR